MSLKRKSEKEVARDCNTKGKTNPTTTYSGYVLVLIRYLKDILAAIVPYHIYRHLYRLRNSFRET